MKKVFLLNGSPNMYGCTYTALKEVADELNRNNIDSEIYHIGTKPVRGCIACLKCRDLKKCVFEDDPCNEILEKMQEADGIVIGSPVYYAGPNGALCAILDRVFYSSLSRKLHHKPSTAVVSCRRGGASASFDRLNKYFTINEMPIVSSQYWNAVHGTTAEEVLKDEEGLQTMRTLAKNMAWMIENLSETKLPKREEIRKVTSFIK